MSEPNPFRHWTPQRTFLLPPSSMAGLLVIELMFFYPAGRIGSAFAMCSSFAGMGASGIQP